MLKIGCHLSISKGYFVAAKNIVNLGGNTFQYFSRNPRGGNVKPWDDEDFNKFKEFAKENNIVTLLTHAPYTLNACSVKEETRDFALMCFKSDLERLQFFDKSLYVFHPGSKGDQDIEAAIKQISFVLNEVLTPDLKTTVLLETMSGKGTEVGKTFEELQMIIDNVVLKDKVGVCFDTCHLYSAGYDIVNDLDNVLKDFDNLIGLDKLKAIHLNDSMHNFDARKDRHAQIGKGSIGLEAIVNIINHPLLKDKSFYLETPHDDELGYKEEIALLKSKYIEQ